MNFAPIVTKCVLKCVQRAPSEAASILHLGRTEATASAMGHKGVTGHRKARGHKGLRVTRRLRATRGLRSTRGLRATWRLRAARELRTPPVRVWAATRTLPPIRVWAAATWSRGDRVRPTGRPIWAAVLWAAHTAVRPSCATLSIGISRLCRPSTRSSADCTSATDFAWIRVSTGLCFLCRAGVECTA